MHALVLTKNWNVGFLVKKVVVSATFDIYKKNKINIIFVFLIKVLIVRSVALVLVFLK
jgi:hypothetical protein